MKTSVYQIARRAFGSYTVVETMEGTLVAASLRAMALQAERQDGEYFEYPEGVTPGQSAAPYGQSGLDWL